MLLDDNDDIKTIIPPPKKTTPNNNKSNNYNENNYTNNNQYNEFQTFLEQESNHVANLKNENQVLRINSSDVAAIAGYHQYKNKCELLQKYVYQDLEELWYLDITRSNIEVIDRDQEIKDCIAKLPAEQVASFKELREKSKDM